MKRILIHKLFLIVNLGQEYLLICLDCWSEQILLNIKIIYKVLLKRVVLKLKDNKILQ
jgi:hypothetical protein